LREELLNEHVKAGVVRHFNDEDYNNLSEEEIKKKYVRKKNLSIYQMPHVIGQK
jgi:hypothetical protein